MLDGALMEPADSEPLILDVESLYAAFGADRMNQVFQEFHEGHLLKQAGTAARMANARRQWQDTPWIDELGPCDHIVDATSFHAWGQYFSFDDKGNYIGDGYECWNDETFIREYLRDNPDSRIRQRAPRVTILNPWGQVAATVEKSPAPEGLVALA